MIVLELVLAGFLLLTALLVALLRDPIEATAVFAAFSLGLAVVWVLLAAPDVALTEAAVGAGVMVILLLIAVARTEWEPSTVDRGRLSSFQGPNPRAVIVIAAISIPLVYTVTSFPDIGDPNAPAVSQVDPAGESSPYHHYIGETAQSLDLPNSVALVLAVFRNLDTLGEVVVAFTALIGVLIVLDRTRITAPRDEPAVEELDYPDPYVMSPVGTTAVRLVIPLVFVFGVYLTLHGAVLPGGGFQGGVVMGASIILMALVFGHRPTGNWVDERLLVWVITIGVGLFLSIAVGSYLIGGSLFDVEAYPIDTVLVVDVLEVAIGLLVGGVVTALVLVMALGPTDDVSESAEQRGDRP